MMTRIRQTLPCGSFFSLSAFILAPPAAKRTAVLVLALVLGLPAASLADPVRVTAGGYTPDFEGHTFRLTGEGFDFSQNELLFIPGWSTAVCILCFPGDTVDLSSLFDGQDYFGSGSGTIDGVAYSSLTYQAWFDFRTPPIVFPETDADFISLTAPFVFTGFLRAFATGEEVFAKSLTGRGIAGAAFFGDSSSGRWLEESQPAYQFAPVPEPATLLLVAAGVLGIRARVGRGRGQFRVG